MWIFIYILLVHWFADFILQTRHMATRKSSSIYYLTMHVLIYSFATTFLWIFCFLAVEIPMTRLSVFGAMGITFVTHWLTDYVTSRYTTKYFLAKKDKEFYSMIGFDQWIHALTLFVTYNYIIL